MNSKSKEHPSNMSNHSSSKSTNPLTFFKITKKLSSGRYSVFHALDTKTKQEVALKIFPSYRCDSVNFRTESTFLRELQHPNIIQLFESFENQQGNSYISTEFAKFGDLYNLIQTHGPMSETLSRTLFLQLLAGVSHIHSKLLAHLDLKVENLLIDENFNLRITDFDLSQSLKDDPSSYRSSGKRGTPGWRAPEVKDGSCKDFIKADVYSLGIVLFVFVSKNPPYSEVSKNGDHEFDVFYKAMRNNNTKFWEAHCRHKNDADFFGKEFQELINWTLKEDPEQRPSIEEILNHKWMKKGVYDELEFKEAMEKYLNV